MNNSNNSNNSNNNNNNQDAEFESIRNSINQLKKKNKDSSSDSLINFKELNSKPAIATATTYGVSALYYNLRGNKSLSKFLLGSSVLVIISGKAITEGYTREGSFLAGATTALISGLSFASAFKHKKFAPLIIGSISLWSMGYHGFYGLYNNDIEKATQTIKSHNENIKQNNNNNNNNNNQQSK